MQVTVIGECVPHSSFNSHVPHFPDVGEPERSQGWSGVQKADKTQIPKQDRQSAPCSEAWGGWGWWEADKECHREETENITDRRRSQGRLPGGGT